MRLMYIFLIIIVTAPCVAQANKISPKSSGIDCTSVNSSPHLDDCVRQEMNDSNARLLGAIESFEKRSRQVYEADPKLGDELIEKVRKAQASWLNFRELNCSIDAFQISEGTPAYVTTINNCIIRMNAERIKALKKLPQ